MKNYFFISVSPRAAKRIISHAVIFSVSIVLGMALVEAPEFRSFVDSNLQIGVLSAFFAGIFFTSAVTSPIGIAMFLLLGQNHHPLLMAFIGAFGSAVGDSLILRFIGVKILDDIHVFTQPLKKRVKLLHAFNHHLPTLPAVILASLIIASPLPDELGITLLAAIKMKPVTFIIFSYVINFLGILAICFFGSVVS